MKVRGGPGGTSTLIAAVAPNDATAVTSVFGAAVGNMVCRHPGAPAPIKGNDSGFPGVL